mgnify:CR=1 FL=1
MSRLHDPDSETPKTSGNESNLRPTGRGRREPAAVGWALRRLVREVIKAGLCTRCGSCVGVCPHRALRISDEFGECLPEQVGPCPDCGAECYLGCPGRYVDFPALNRILYGGQPEHWLLGYHRGIWAGHAADPQVRSMAASGGFITATLEHLFQTGRIEGAQVLGMDPDRPYRARPFLARTPAEARTACQSKYTVSPHNVLLQDIPPDGPPLAYVGLPCHVHSLRKLQQLGHPVARRFRYVVGSYCGNILHFSSVKAFLAKHGVRDLEAVRHLDYRHGEWPGNFRVELRSGRVISMPKFHANYLIPFHILHRCLLCADLANEFADLAGGDAWAPEYEERGKGFSLIIARSAWGQEIIDEMVSDGKLHVVPITASEAIRMHSHGLDLKKRGTFLRIARRRAAHLPVPEYGFRCHQKLPWKRRGMERIMGLAFRICRTRLARTLIQWVPNGLIGVAFRTARNWWKTASYGAKRRGLEGTSFLVDPPGGQASTDWKACGRDPLASCSGSIPRPESPR